MKRFHETVSCDIFSTVSVSEQVPLAWVNDMDRTLEPIGSNAVWIQQAGEGSYEKRMCTLNVCFSPSLDGPQPRLAMIFHGKGLRIKSTERAQWHPDIDVSFNEKAWATDEWCMEHIAKQAPVVPGRQGAQALLLCDNLSGQCSKDFRKMMLTKLNVLVWNLHPGTTDMTQPLPGTVVR